ncbi:hypothetical protein N1851_000279 [Merluccius polli]|uniref:Uncharacterized protein n=1 Tax=Merluccius polli TaxID=89951 RepID=A0AA47NDB3_MERPO|nr:hypothetical protein N1851_000279 [Merluccius polli]
MKLVATTCAEQRAVHALVPPPVNIPTFIVFPNRLQSGVTCISAAPSLARTLLPGTRGEDSVWCALLLKSQRLFFLLLCSGEAALHGSVPYPPPGYPKTQTIHGLRSWCGRFVFSIRSVIFIVFGCSGTVAFLHTVLCGGCVPTQRQVPRPTTTLICLAGAGAAGGRLPLVVVPFSPPP